jgi:alpha-glucosidase
MKDLTKMQSPKWWQTAVIYEVYLRSFHDSNGDGIGDIKGVTSKLDYLQWLGVNAVWITPFYPSPMADFGYDISDYRGVDPLFGSMNDVEELIEQLHSRKMKLIIDLVPNHTSDKHPWFTEARSSKDNPKRDWYIWKDAKAGGEPPNNWLSVLGGSAWEWDKNTGQFYYHAFLKEQPDLNFRNPEVIEALSDLMRYWLEKGVDGFRIDALWHLIKDEQFRDNPPNPDFKESMPDCDKLKQIYSCDQPEVHEVIAKLRGVLDEYDERVMIGEIYLPAAKVVAYYGDDCGGANLPTNFQMFFIPWITDKIALAVDEYEAALAESCWPNWTFGNHDKPRLHSRVGDDQLRNAAMLLLTLRGTPTLYYGEEIGMSQVKLSKEEMKDPQGLNMPGKNLSRDPQRTPMQWNSEKNAGFSEGQPWLRIDDNYKKVNVELMKDDTQSLLVFYKQLIQLRQKEPALNVGNYKPMRSDDKTICFIRQTEKRDNFLMALNLSGERANLLLDKNLQGVIEISAKGKLEGQKLSSITKLDANDGIIVRLENELL